MVRTVVHCVTYYYWKMWNSRSAHCINLYLINTFKNWLIKLGIQAFIQITISAKINFFLKRGRVTINACATPGKDDLKSYLMSLLNN